MALLVLGRIFQGSIGYGDGLVLIDTGILLGAPDNLELFFTALFFAGFLRWLAVCFFIKKEGYVSFCTVFAIAYVGMLLWGMKKWYESKLYHRSCAYFAGCTVFDPHFHTDRDLHVYRSKGGGMPLRTGTAV